MNVNDARNYNNETGMASDFTPLLVKEQDKFMLFCRRYCRGSEAMQLLIGTIS